jgi:tetratricopeptide (TPR) repeat protein
MRSHLPPGGHGWNDARDDLGAARAGCQCRDEPGRERAGRGGGGAGGGASALRLRGLDYGFNLDYPQALDTFQQAVAANPEDATAVRLAGAAIWMRLLFEQGAVTVEDYLGQARATVTRKPPSPELAAAFHAYIDRALAMAEARVQSNPADADAQFQLGAAAGLRASYIATVEGRVRDSVGVARRAYAAQKRCMTLDPSRKDAGLIVGLYQYAIASLSFPMRIIARLVGFESGRENGLRLVEEASRYPQNPQTQGNALFALVLLYSREGHDDALRTVHRLQELYPRNRLLMLEAGSAALRAGRPEEALRAIDDGFALLSKDSRPRAYGEEARWHYLRGAALVLLHKTDDANRELQSALAMDGPGWIRGRAQLELGKVADLAGDRTRAIGGYRRAGQECTAEHDSGCADEARKYTAAAYR